MTTKRVKISREVVMQALISLAVNTKGGNLLPDFIELDAEILPDPVETCPTKEETDGGSFLIPTSACI